MSQEDIEDLIEKRMRTIMIGSLARFEENFDYLWNEESEDKTYFIDLWQKTRQDILDYGNNQIRLARKDFGNMNIYQNKSQPTKYRYKYRFDIRRNDNEY